MLDSIMAAGLACGIGYVMYALLFSAAVGVIMALLTRLRFGEGSRMEKSLRITIPEEMDYTGLFDDLFAEYTSNHILQKFAPQIFASCMSCDTGS